MMSFKSVFSVVALSALTFGFTACDDDKDDDKKPADQPQVTCDCATGANCTEAEKAKCGKNEKTCDCATGANCSDAEKAACNKDEKKCDCATGANCSDAEKTACNALKTDLQACDIKAASAKLDAAWNADKTNVDVAFQRSVVGIINLMNHDKVQAIMPKLGFNSTDVSFLYKDKGLFAEMVRKIDENADNDRFDGLEGQFDHKVFGKCKGAGNCKKFKDDGVLDANLTLGDLLQVFLDMESDIASLSESLKVAADGMANETAARKVSLAGCGLGEIGLSASDLYLIAGGMDLTRSAAHLASAYTLNTKLVDYVKAPDGDDGFEYHIEAEDTDEAAQQKIQEAKSAADSTCNSFNTAWTALMKDLFVVSNASKALAGRALFLSGAEKLKAAANAKKASGSFFGWNQLIDGSIADINTIADSIKNNNNGLVTVNLFTPSISLDLSKIFDAPVSADANAFKPACIVYANGNGNGQGGYYYSKGSWASFYTEGYEVDPKDFFGFLASDKMKPVFNNNLFYDFADVCVDSCMEDLSKDECEARCNDYETNGGSIKYIDSYADRYELEIKDNQEASFSDAWEKMDFDLTLNPNEYFYNNEEED